MGNSLPVNSSTTFAVNTQQSNVSGNESSESLYWYIMSVKVLIFLTPRLNLVYHLKMIIPLRP
jgi:hypothetical protein